MSFSLHSDCQFPYPNDLGIIVKAEDVNPCNGSDELNIKPLNVPNFGLARGTHMKCDSGHAFAMAAGLCSQCKELVMQSYFVSVHKTLVIFLN